MPSHPLASVLDAYNDAWNRHDVDAILALHTADSIFENHTSGGRGQGEAAIRAIVASVFEAFPDIHFTFRRIYVKDDLAVQEWTATATHVRPTIRGGKTYPATGKKVAWNGADILPMAHGKIARKDVYVDSIGLLRQLGVTEL